jgi:hypothetical protein
MRKLPLNEIEELVEESVFHPSPCKRHRERVLKKAVQATVRQAVSRRTIAAASAVVVVLGIGIVIVRLATSASPAGSDAAVPASSAAADTGTGTPAAQSAPVGSLGEGLYRATPNQAEPQGNRQGGL